MKKCLCCGAESASEAQACADCGEGSWSTSVIESAPIDKFTEPFVEHTFDSSDPVTAVEVPARRRRNR